MWLPPSPTKSRLRMSRRSVGRSGQGGRANKKPPLPPTLKKAPWKGKQQVDQKALDDSGLCYYHFMYADEATKCRKPCAWSGN